MRANGARPACFAIDSTLPESGYSQISGVSCVEIDRYFSGASDVFKLAMIKVDRALQAHPKLRCHMLLTVHDELVFEVDASRVEEAAKLVKDEMESAYELEVPLRADIGWGASWEEAAPAGH